MARKRAAALIITRANEHGEVTTYRRDRKRYVNGRGSVYQRSRDGKWVAALPLGGGKTKTWVCRSEAEAEAKLQEALEHAGAVDRSIDPRSPTLCRTA